MRTSHFGFILGVILVVTLAAPSVSAGHSTVSISRSLKYPFYGHGASFGFAGKFLDDSRWMSILKLLQPSVYSDITRKSFKIKDSMFQVENNPILAAYAYEHARTECRSCSSEHILQGFEWDLFIPPEASTGNPMTNSILIAHGVGSKHLRKEGQGINQYYEVKRIKQTEMGGVVLSVWKDHFTRSLWMIRDYSRRSSYVSKSVSWSDFAAAYKAGQPGSANQPFHAILDIKSGSASVSLIKAIIKDLNSKGVIVAGVGSFNRNQVIGVDSVSQNVGNQSGVRARPVLFYHGLRQRSIALLFGLSALPPQLLDDADSGNLPKNVGILFNGGFLIDYDSFATGTSKRKSYKLDRGSVKELQNAKIKYNLNLGFYVQEPDEDRWALQIMFDLANSYPSTFDLGFAWGGMFDEWYTEIEPSFTDATVGTDAQAFLAVRTARGVGENAGNDVNNNNGNNNSKVLHSIVIASASVAGIAAVAVGIIVIARKRSAASSSEINVPAVPEFAAVDLEEALVPQEL